VTDDREEIGAEKESPWSFSRLRQRAPTLCYTLLLWLTAELLVALIAPVAVPRHVALSWYLGAEARRATRLFLDDRNPCLMYDALTGWRNRPGSGAETWRVDSLGSRSTHPLGLVKSRPRRLLFLGSSLINGNWRVTTGETISAYCEDSLTEAVNCATMLYSLDQSLLALRGGLHRLGADVVVVGLPDDPDEGLTNRYLPFHRRTEVLMPFFKPRFVLAGATTRLVPVPTCGQWRTLLTDSALLDSLARSDGCFGDFESYRRFGLMPLSAGLRRALLASRKLSRLVAGRAEAGPLACLLMRQLVNEAAQCHARTVFMLLPERSATFPSPWRRLLTDRHATVLNELRREGFVVLDGREPLRASGLQPWELYQWDGIHYSPPANRILASRLMGLIRSLEGPARPGSVRKAAGGGPVGAMVPRQDVLQPPFPSPGRQVGGRSVR
jgi:hypothetical protein